MNTARGPVKVVGSPPSPGAFVKALFSGVRIQASENEPHGVMAQTAPFCAPTAAQRLAPGELARPCLIPSQ